LRMRIILSILLGGWAAASPAAVWVGHEGGLRHYSNDGELVRDYRDYRRPISLLYDEERKRLWFLDAYDYKLVCLDVEAGREVLTVPNAAHAPAVGTSDLGVYLLEKKPFEPSLALDPTDGSVWVADFYGHEIAKYGADGKEVFRSGAFHEPFAVAVLGDCYAWVAGGIRTLSLVGPQCDTRQTMTGVSEARDLAFDAERDLVWVADYRNNRVFAINRDGRLKRKITGVELPERLAVDSERGTVWVATHYAGVVKISADAEKITASIPEPDSIAAIAVAGDGKLWVAYNETEEIVCLSPAGEEVAKIKRVNGPTGVAAD
jgi:sugar lactone lactonase YvrE